MQEESLLAQICRMDHRLGQLERRLAEIPGALDALRAAGVAGGKHAQLRQDQIDELALSMRRLEQDAQFEREKLRKLELRQQKVSSLEAMQAGEHEMATLRRSIASTEERLLEKLEAQEILEREADLRAAAENEEVKALRREADELALELERSRSMRDQLGKERASLLAELPAPLRRRYDRVFTVHGHHSLVALRDGACGGCGAKLPPQIVLELRSQARIESCQDCGRLILWVEA